MSTSLHLFHRQLLKLLTSLTSWHLHPCFQLRDQVTWQRRYCCCTVVTKGFSIFTLLPFLSIVDYSCPLRNKLREGRTWPAAMGRSWGSAACPLQVMLQQLSEENVSGWSWLHNLGQIAVLQFWYLSSLTQEGGFWAVLGKPSAVMGINRRFEGWKKTLCQVSSRL